MTYGLRIRRGSTVSFDSSLAAGGVCLGIFNVPPGGGNFDFPAFPTATGIAMSAGTGAAASLYTTNNAPGWLRFVFPRAAQGAQVALFAK